MQQISTETQTEPFRFSIVEQDEHQTIIEVSQEDYEKSLASGVAEDEQLKPGKHVFKRRKQTTANSQPPNVKVEVMVQLDLDVLNYFKTRAEATNAADYKTQINDSLREIMRREQQSEARDVETRLLQNPDFIRALAQELKKVA